MRKKPKRKTPASSLSMEADLPKTRQYKVVEVAMVDDLSLETELNTWSRQGWHFESIQFAMRESSKRPSMAFIFFVKSTPSDEVSNESKLKGPRTSSQNARHRLLQLAGLTDQDESL